MSYLSRLREVVGKDPSGEPTKATEAPFEPFVGPSPGRLAGLPPAVIDGLTHLGGMPTPRLRFLERWPVALADAQRIAADGWAAKALSLGWSPLDLFGAVTDADGDPEADGLAAKLDGRKILALCASFATVADASGGRSYLYRGSNTGAVLLWALGRGVTR